MAKKKKCTACGMLLSISKENFYYYRRGGGEYINSKCKECVKKQVKAWSDNNKDRVSKRNKKWREENIEHVLSYGKEYKRKHKSKIKEKNREYYEQNKDFILKKNKQYRTENAEKIRQYESSPEVLLKKRSRAKKARENNIEKYREYDRSPKRRRQKRLAVQKKRKNDPLFRMRTSISRAIRRAIFKRGESKRGKSILNYLPYSMEDLRNHLEQQFEPWMTWDNYGSASSKDRTWQIDHIIPQSKLSYDSMDHPNFLKCWSLENLRPLDAIENIKRGDKYV